MTDERCVELVERASAGPFKSEQEGYKEVPFAAVDIRTFEKDDGWYITWRRTVRGPAPWGLMGNGEKTKMTDEEAREDIKTEHGFKPDWLVEKILAAYERYRARELSPLEALEQAILYYLASHGAASFDEKTGLYSAI